MKCKCRLIAAALAIGSLASVAQAQLLYEQTFNPPNNPGGYAGAIGDSGWLVEAHADYGSGAGYSGTYQGNFAATGLVDAANNQPINGNTGVYIGVGGPVTGGLGAFYVTEGLGGFEAIDPATCERLILSVYANLQPNNGLAENDLGYFAVRMGDFDPRTADDAWYISSSPMAEPTTSAEFFNLRRLEFDPSPGNWLPLSLGPLTVGPGPVDLTGLQITGAGIVQENTNPNPLPNYDVPDGYGSWNYADYQINCVPEPSAFLLLAVTAPMSLALRRRRT